MAKNSRESTLRQGVHQLKQLLAEKVLEVDFLIAALLKIEARRQRIGSSGNNPSQRMAIPLTPLRFVTSGSV